MTATVRIERTDESSVAVRVDGLAVPPATRAVRLVLAPDATPDLGALAQAASVVTLPVVRDPSGGSSPTIDDPCVSPSSPTVSGVGCTWTAWLVVGRPTT